MNDADFKYQLIELAENRGKENYKPEFKADNITQTIEQVLFIDFTDSLVDTGDLTLISGKPEITMI